MGLRITSAKLTGSPDSSGWAQIHDFAPSEEEKLKTRGHLFAVVSRSFKEAKGEDDSLHTTTSGREIIARLQEEYFGNTTLVPFNALKKACEKVLQQFSTSFANVEIAAASIVGEFVYSAAGGGGEVAIFRGGSFVPIIKSNEGVVTAASGKPKQGDFLVLSSSDFFSGKDTRAISEVFASNDPAAVVEEFATRVHASSEQGSKALAVISFSDESENVAEDTTQVQEVKEEAPVSHSRDKIEFPKPKLSDRLFRLPKIKIFNRNLYIRKSEVDVAEHQKRKTLVSVGVILLILLVASIGFGIRQQAVNRSKAEFEGKLTEIRHNLEEAKNLFGLNPSRARELFSQTKDLIDKLANEGVNASELESLRKIYEEGRATVLGEFDAVADEFVDLSLIEGFEGQFLVSTTDALYAYDKGKSRIVEVIIDTKKTEVVVGPSQIEEVDALAVYSDRIFISENDGIFEVGDTRRRVLEKDWEGDILISAYAGNMYLLEKESSKIWRYPGSAEEFGERANWLAPGIEPNLEGVVSMAIDGTIWILTKGGNIERYSHGSPQNLNDIKVFPALNAPTVIYTNEELENIYVLDSNESRVVVFDKEGNYKVQYKSGTLKEAIGLSASEKEGKIIFLTKDKLYTLPISQ